MAGHVFVVQALKVRNVSQVVGCLFIQNQTDVFGYKQKYHHMLAAVGRALG